VNAPAAPTGLVIVGATGRMGASLIRLLPEYPSFRLHGALARAGSETQGRDSGEQAGTAATGVPVSTSLDAALEGAGLVLDFSAADAAATHVEQCAAAGIPLLLGTTGLGPEVSRTVEVAARRIPVLVAPNTSLGASVLIGLVGRAAGLLGTGYAVSIRDVHHRSKRDAPSGTALALGAAVQQASPEVSRPVDFRSIREGDAVSQHDVEFVGPGEWLRLSHNATDRAALARGALRAGLWLVDQGPGRYEMADFLGEK
jgi:4-hydroxy-tetrahydrodipicolinate reductase